MKKSLLCILASGLLVVGCQDYDDQFAALETQINALASTVAGLSQVQSDLASLAGTVGSLASTVNGLGDQIDTAVADGLSDIQSDIDAITTAVADVASSEEVAALQTAVDDSQEDLDELLASSAVFTGTVTVNSVSTLEAFHAMKASLAIVNGSVDIDMDSEMDAVMAQELIDAIKTVTGGFDYAADKSTVTEMTFNNLTGVQSLTLKQAGSYKAQALKSATVITLNDAFESKVTNIDFRALTSVSKFVTGAASAAGTDNKIDFNQAEEVHLTVLPRYAPGTLTINMDEGGALPISELDDVDANGDQADLTLDITGPDTVTLTKITDGAITLTDVENASITGFTGQLTIKGGVEQLTVVDGVKVSVVSATDLVSANIDLKLDDDADLTAVQTAALDYGTNGDLDFTGLTDLTNVTISGQVNDITLSGNSNLETVVITAKSDDLTISGAGDLTSVTVTGAEFNDVSITNNTDLEALTLDHTTRLTVTGTKATDVETGASLTVTGNSKLASLVSGADHIDALTVQNNAKLASVDFTGLKDGGTTKTATVAIGGSTTTNNDLSATLITDSYDVAPATLDTGSFTNESGIKTLKEYLDVVVAKPSTSGVKVFLDSADSHIAKGATIAADVETTSLVIGASAATTAKLAVVNVDISDAVTAASAIAAIRSAFLPHGGTEAEVDAIEGYNPASVSDVDASSDNQALWATEFITDFGANYTAVGVTVTYVEAGAAVGARTTGSATFDVRIQAAAATEMAYGESIKLGVGATTVSIPLSMTGTATTGSVTIAGVAVGFDTTSGTGAGTQVYPHQAAYSKTGSGTAYVSSSTELIAAIVAYMNQADRTTADYKNATSVAGSQDKNRWTVTADATAETLNFQIDGYMTKALTGAIVAEHMDGADTTEQTISRFEDETINAVTTVYSDGVILRFAKTATGADSNFTLGISAGSKTLFNDWEAYDGADNTVYAPAATTGNNSALYRGLVADTGYGGTHTAATPATAALVTAANETNDDNLTDSDFAFGANAGDATANTAADTDRTNWL